MTGPVSKYSVENIVFAKVKYYPHSPGKMTDIILDKGKAQSITYFLENKTSTVKTADLLICRT